MFLPTAYHQVKRPCRRTLTGRPSTFLPPSWTASTTTWRRSWKNRRGSPKRSTWHQAQCALHARTPTRLLPEQVPGLGRLRAFIAAEFRTGLSVEAVYMIRGRYCLACGVDEDQADQATLEQVARAVVPPAPGGQRSEGL